MDEILASIRKIIENNETQPESLDAGRPAEPYHGSADADDELLRGRPERPPVDILAFHAEEPAESADLAPLPLVEDETPPAQPALSLADVAARVRAASERHVASRAPAIPEPVAEEIEPVAPEPAVAVSAPAEEPSQDAVALMSPDAGERVAQSFGALAQAFDAGPRRSFDEIAEDMLRPMLREWLDDNLPTLVERLVREEIERVARGPRR